MQVFKVKLVKDGLVTYKQIIASNRGNALKNAILRCSSSDYEVSIEGSLADGHCEEENNGVAEK